MRRTVGTATSRYLWDGDDLFADLDGAGSRVAEYVHFPGVDRPHSQRRGGQVSYYATDHPGHVLGLIDGANVLWNEYEYLPFGGGISATEGVSNALRFGGRETEGGLYFHRARYLDPELGRFLSEDPIGLGGGINPFVYGTNDPINSLDPTGCFSLFGGLVGVVGGFFTGGVAGAIFGGVVGAFGDELLGGSNPPTSLPNPFGGLPTPPFGNPPPGDPSAPSGFGPLGGPFGGPFGGFFLSTPGAAGTRLQACLRACEKGTDAIERFCRRIPERRVRAACWGVSLLGGPACKNFCYLFYSE